MAPNVRTSFFEYWDEAPHDWAKALQELRGKGHHQVIIPVLWGVHESAPGIRDFSKQTKFRIEKLLTLIQAAGLTAKVVTGLPAHNLSFPNWVFDEPQREWVPKILWDNEPPYFSMVSLPSPRSKRIREGLFSFLDEVSSILSLYLAPGGPVTEVKVDLKPLEFSQTLSAVEGYTKVLERRYPDIDVFNSRFQTHYRNIDSVANPSGAKLIEAKRPWLFAFDYRWCRDQIVRDYFTQLESTENFSSLRYRFSQDSGLNSKAVAENTSAIGLSIESTWLESADAENLSPFMPEGMLTQTMVSTFQWGNLIREGAQSLGIDFFPLPVLPGVKIPGYRLSAVICGKYMSSAASSHLYEQLNQGSQIFFPTGFPQYDENLETQELFLGGQRKSVRLKGAEWFEVSKGKGKLYVPTQSTVFSSPRAVQLWLKDFHALAERNEHG